MRRITHAILHTIRLCLTFLIFCALATSTVHAPFAVAAPPTQQATPYPILFVTQVPLVAGFTSIASTFGNHQGKLDLVGRGGDLWIRYPDGTLKNLTAAAGYGIASGLQAGANSIAVRDPAVHWSGTKAIFSMVMGAPTRQYDYNWQNVLWQMYEISGLGQNETPVITKVANQPANYNNVSPLYGSDGRIIFTSDRPRLDAVQLYPQRDEYELAATVSGLWSLNPTNGDLRMLNHAPSGDFTPIIDSYGRVIFTQWDHLQRDQQADADDDDSKGDNQCNNGGNQYGTFNYSDESANATYTLGVRNEIFPEPRQCRKDLLAGTNLQGHAFNQFFPWMINQDGTESELLNHLGRHELQGYIERTFINDDNLLDFYTQITRFNPNSIQNMFQIKEDALVAGRYYGVDAAEFGTHAAGYILRLDAPPLTNADHISVTYLTRKVQSNDPNHPGLFREPLPLSNGTLLAVHTADSSEESGNNTTNSSYEFRIKFLTQGTGVFLVAGPTLTNGISKTISYWSPDVMVTYSGNLWELNPVEVRSRPIPSMTQERTLESPEQQIFSQAGVDVAAMQGYLKQNNLALAVIRNATERDDFDLQQPFNLRVPGGVQTLNPNKPGKIYDITHLQIFQGDQLRGWTGCCGSTPAAGRRVLAQLLHDPAALTANPPITPNTPPSSFAIAADGSVAAFVPARRSMTWQLTDATGTGIVRERYWITFQPGEIRTCPACHGPSERDQAGNLPAQNPPQALLSLLQTWKSQQGGGGATATPTVTPSPTTVGAATATSTATRTATATGVPATATAIPTATTTPPPIVASPQISGCAIFPPDNIWNTPIDTLPVDANSAAYLNTIGLTRTLHADFGAGLWEGGPIGIPYMTVPGSQPKVPITFQYANQSDPGPYPIPPNAPIEGGPNSTGDRHILVVERDSCTLYETWSTYPQNDGSWKAGSGARFDLKSHTLRPDTWTSADAAGLPILPGLVRYDEVASGEIKHAIRFTVPRTRNTYVWPARHAASDLTEMQYPPMGQYFRLKANYDISTFDPKIQVILRAMKKYGIILADNGSAWYLSGVPDERWNNDILRQLGRVPGEQFEAVNVSSLMLNPNSGQVKGSGAATATPTATGTAIGPATTTPTATPTLPAQKARLTIVQSAQPKSKQNFRYGGTLGSFQLDDASPNDNDGIISTRSFTVTAGSYVITQSVPAEWLVASITCDPASKAQVELSTQRITLNLLVGDQVRCTVTDARAVSIRSVQFNDLNANKRRDSGEAWLSGWTMTVYNSAGQNKGNATTNSLGKANFNLLPPGSYTVCESLSTDWINTLPGTLHPTYQQPCYSFSLTPAQIGVVNFGNRRKVSEAESSTIPPTSLAEGEVPMEGVEILQMADVPSDEAGYEEQPFVDEDVNWPVMDQKVFLPSAVR